MLFFNEFKILTKLKKFVEKIIQKLTKLMKDGEIFNITEEIITPKVENFSFDKQAVRYNSTITTKNIITPNYKKYLEFISDFCKSLPEFNNIISNMRDVYQKEENYINKILDNFFFSLISKTQKGITNELIENEIENLMNDLEMESIKWNVKIWIYCIWVEDVEYHLAKDLKIRRISPQEIEFVTINEPFPLFERIDFGIPTANHIIEFNIEINVKNVDQNKTFSNIPIQDKIRFYSKRCIEEEIEIILLTFRLYKLGAVFPYKYEMRTESFIQSGVLKGFYPDKIKNIYDYGITKKDIPFLSEIYVFLRKTELRDKLLAQQEEYNYLSLAIQRYNNAFLNAETRESLITYTISCLEALFLKDNERMDLKRTLSQRISIIMKIFKFNPILIYNLIDVAYKIRSKYSHGGITKRKDLDNLAKKILDFTRISLLNLIQLDAKIEKIEVIKDIRDLINIDDWNLIKKDSSLIKNRKNILLDFIDYSLLDNDLFLELTKLILNNCKIYQNL